MGDALQNRQIPALPTSCIITSPSSNFTQQFHILVREQSEDLLNLLHYKKCLSSLKSTDITLSYEIFLRETNLNRGEPFSKYNRLSLH